MRGIALAVALFLLSGCDPWDSSVFTLYRNSVVDPAMRIHVATFDADEKLWRAGPRAKELYNSENCELAAKLFGGQDGVKRRYWCEKGRYRP